MCSSCYLKYYKGLSSIKMLFQNVFIWINILPIVGIILVSSANSSKKMLTVKYITLFTSVLTLVLSYLF